MLLKVRMLDREYAVVVATRVEGLWVAIVSPCDKVCDQRVDVESNTGSYIVSRWRLLATAGANKAIVLIVLLAFLCM